MHLFQIDEAVFDILNTMSNSVNEETGEIIDEEQYVKAQQDLERLQITQEEKIENLACYCKNLQAEDQTLIEQLMKQAVLRGRLFFIACGYFGKPTLNFRHLLRL